MPEKKTLNSEISQRLSTLVDEVAGGNSKQFSEKAGINQATFHNYLKGRSPNTESLFNICFTYKVNLNWLVAGIGPKFMTASDGSRKNQAEQKRPLQILEDVQEWLLEICEEEPERKDWFKIELMDKVPNFKEWLKKRNEAETETNNFKIAL
ncbi:MAG: hypothetical protein OEV64_12200 [Desulfobulbaceae bacterium]|nr:hypothetical protein [Desulfobulbaceae bacterium]